MKDVQGRCELCEKERTLRESHIIPKFVFRWLKKAAGSFIRKADNPNKREEDGMKKHLLCGDCEQLFSRLEDKFARDIFYPYANNKKETFSYDTDLLKFSVSVLYRILVFNNIRNNIFDNLHAKDLTLALDEWKGYLFANKKLEKFSKVHIFFTSGVLNQRVLPAERFLSYYSFAVDGTIASSNMYCIVYAKMARIILIGEIVNLDNLGMKNTLINLSGGELKVRQMKLGCQIKEFLIDRVRTLNVAYDKVSEKQKNIAIEYSSNYLKYHSNTDISNTIENENGMRVDNDLLDFE